MEENKKPENPFAFPYSDDLNGYSQDGMTLRDYFAAKAMQALLIKDGTINFDIRSIEAYEVADEMLKQREQCQ